MKLLDAATGGEAQPQQPSASSPSPADHLKVLHEASTGTGSGTGADAKRLAGTGPEWKSNSPSQQSQSTKGLAKLREALQTAQAQTESSGKATSSSIGSAKKGLGDRLGLSLAIDTKQLSSSSSSGSKKHRNRSESRLQKRIRQRNSRLADVPISEDAAVAAATAASTVARGQKQQPLPPRATSRLSNTKNSSYREGGKTFANANANANKTNEKEKGDYDDDDDDVDDDDDDDDDEQEDSCSSYSGEDDSDDSELDGGISSTHKGGGDSGWWGSGLLGKGLSMGATLMASAASKLTGASGTAEESSGGSDSDSDFESESESEEGQEEGEDGRNGVRRGAHRAKDRAKDREKRQEKEKEMKHRDIWVSAAAPPTDAELSGLGLGVPPLLPPPSAIRQEYEETMAALRSGRTPRRSQVPRPPADVLQALDGHSWSKMVRVPSARPRQQQKQQQKQQQQQQQQQQRQNGNNSGKRPFPIMFDQDELPDDAIHGQKKSFAANDDDDDDDGGGDNDVDDEDDDDVKPTVSDAGSTRTRSEGSGDFAELSAESESAAASLLARRNSFSLGARVPSGSKWRYVAPQYN
jgi:hypothetical protein